MPACKNIPELHELGHVAYDRVLTDAFFPFIVVDRHNFWFFVFLHNYLHFINVPACKPLQYPKRFLYNRKMCAVIA